MASDNKLPPFLYTSYTLQVRALPFFQLNYETPNETCVWAVLRPGRIDGDAIVEKPVLVRLQEGTHR